MLFCSFSAFLYSFLLLSYYKVQQFRLLHLVDP